MRGAYGLGVHIVGDGGPAADAGLLTAPPETTEVVTVERRLDPDFEPVTDEDRLLGDDEMRWPMLLGGRLDASRGTGRAVVTTPFGITDDDLVHPYLSPIGAIWSRWLGREPFHCSAAVIGGRVWGILGPREAGKSTLVAWLATHDVPIMTDDLLVVDTPPGPDGAPGPPIAYAGPRSIDLRPPTAKLLLDDGIDPGRLESVRDGERHRLRLPDVPWSLPMGGWFILGEADHLDVTSVPVTERLAVLADHRMVRREVKDGVQWMNLATLPTFRLSRPKDWALMPTVVEAMRTAVASTA